LRERWYLVSGDALPTRLPATGEEARQIAALYGAEPLIGEEATEAAVRTRMSGAVIVHLATHGYFHPRLAMSSGLLLTPPASEPVRYDETQDDGALQAWEFGGWWELGADLVVLSACETGPGEGNSGAGLLGLTRAIQGAGARSVVTTSWRVADESSTTLMTSFHEKLRQGLPRDEALQRALAETAARPGTDHPFYWAPFVLIGDADRPLGVYSSPSRGRIVPVTM
jgi:CHAT domain-containing protein